MIFGIKFVKKLFDSNFLPHDFNRRPVIVVYRNTDSSGIGLADVGNNNCDRILLVDADGVNPGTGTRASLSGRSYPHDKYQKKMVDGIAKANYISSGYYPTAWKHGLHLGRFEALRQVSPFMVWRSKDMELMDEDDYNEYAPVCDNFHGWAPNSAGCVTTEGQMRPPTEDWAIAHEWLYGKHAKQPLFSLAIFQHDDFDCRPRMRIGSKGPAVAAAQGKLNELGARLTVDGDFGPASHHAVKDLVDDSGILLLKALQ